MKSRLRTGIAALTLLGWTGAIGASGCGDETDGDDAESPCGSSVVAGAVAAYGPEPRDPTKMALAGVLIGSCIPDDGITRWTDNMYESPGNGDDGEGRFDESCLAARDDGCAAVAACTGLSVDLSGPCEGGCSNGRSEGCDDSLHFTHCCGVLGMECADGEDECVLDADLPECSPGDHVATCVDGHPVACIDGRETPGADCAAWGLTCGISTLAGAAACVGTGPACAEASASSYGLPLENGIRCDSERLVICAGGAEHSLDCTMIAPGFSCQEVSGAFFCGMASECNPDGQPNGESCEGTRVTFCHAGKIEQVDCTALGFTGCAMPGSDAVCTPNGWSQ